ncbi:MAG: glucose-6-phosphate isomerase [Prevotella sp.]|nr:glucose-6-phosphate isomerase [Prevotella sp.]
MKTISLDITKATQFLAEEAVAAYEPKVKAAQEALENGTCAGNDFLGWLHLPSSITPEFIDEVQATADMLREKCEVVVVAGIGGSYLGARAVIEALGNSFAWLLQDKGANPTILFAGNNISEDYLAELTDYLRDKKFGVINISKSGTTTETALTFRLLKKQCETQRGKEEARKVIVAITDAVKGAARTCADKEGYKSFVIPDNVGGRFSVLTPVGLLPIAIAGFDIKALVQGAQDMERACGKDVPFEENIATQYAAVRNALYAKGKKIEIMVNYQPKLHFMAEWWKQLYGESEGKEGKAIFPASCDFTTDLHSMGQWIQEGERSIFETVISVEQPNRKMLFPEDEENLDGLNFLAGKRVDEVNKMAELGTQLAHVDGGVPNIRIAMPELNAYYIGQLIYFFEIGCGISGLVLGINPFNQPGVEAYKKNMFALLNKPGYEAESKAIQERLKAHP